MEQDLNLLSLDDLIQIYQNEVEPLNFKEIAELFNIPLTKAGKINNQTNYKRAREQAKEDIIAEINEVRKQKQQNLAEPAPPIIPYKPPPKIDEDKLTMNDIDDLGHDNLQLTLDPLNETERLRLENEELRRQNDLLINYIKEKYPPPNIEIQPTKTFPQAPKIDESKPDLNNVQLKHTETNFKDSLLKQAQKEYKKESNSFNYLKQTPQKDEQHEFFKNKFKQQIEKENDDIRAQYEYLAAEHENPQTYNDYLETVKKQNTLIKELKNTLNQDSNNYFIDFNNFDTLGKKQLQKFLINWFENKIGQLAIKDHYRIHYRIGDDWYSAPLKEVYNKLLQNLKEGHLIYNMDESPTWAYDSDKQYNLPEWSLFDAIMIKKIDNHGVYRGNSGHFFEYLADETLPKKLINYLERFQIFTSLSIDNKTQRSELDDCCFIYALKQTGKFDEGQLNLMRMRIKSRYLSVKSINSICEEFKIKLILRRIDLEDKTEKIKAKGDKFIGYKEASEEMTFNIDLFNDHWMIHEDKTPFSASYIKNINIAPEDAEVKSYELKHGVYKWVNHNPIRYISSSKMILELMKQNKFIPINYATAAILKTTLYESVKDKDFPLEYDENACLRLICPNKPTKKNKENENPKSYYYADFEADTSGDVHKPFLCVCQSEDGKINKVFKGPNCAREFLNFLPDGAICYFHNLCYDWAMFNRFATSIIKVIKKGSKVYQAKIYYHKKQLLFKDSLPIFMSKLSVLPTAFKLENIKKELFPYNYYLLECLKYNIGKISEAGKDEVKPWTEEQYKTFNENIDSIPGCRIGPDTFDMYKYAEFYCIQDVRILREAFEKLCKGFMEEFNINVKEKLTTPALANEFFEKSVYIPNGNLYFVGGNVQKFMSRAVYGGRCMTAFNKKWHTTNLIYDFDAVSLYPSAMRRLWCVENKPEVLKVEEPDKIYNSMPENLQKYNTKDGIGAFVVEIKILKANKHYAFPLIVQKTPEGNLNDDNIIEPVNMVVDNIALEDLIEFQQIEFQVIKGYVFNGARDYKIQEVIQKVFDTRLKYKAEKNPLEQLYKLIMNSSYGKTIQKPVDFDIKYLTKWRKGNELSKYESYYTKNYNKVVETLYENDDFAILKVKTETDKHFNFSLLGIQVLSMSKRIINEMSCLAFDIGCHIYYTDTDSVHIEANDLPKLEKAFIEKYQRPLIGKNMGQFHNDYPAIKGHDEIPKSIESYFVQKKLYIDKLQDSTGEIDYMIRGKGLTQESIKYTAEKHGGFMNLYKKLFEGEEITFNLCDGQACFEMKKDFTVSTRKKFERKVKTTYPEGDRNNYFLY